MAYIINNNALEVDPSPRRKRKRSLQCTNAYMNPALDLLSTEDTMCNTQMEINAKKKRRSKSCDSRVVFENSALDIGVNNKAINGLLRKELTNVNEKLAPISEVNSPRMRRSFSNNEDNFREMMMEEKFIINMQSRRSVHVNSTPMINNATRRTSFDLSFIEKLGITDSPGGDALYLDDDLNESNIMEIKTITTIPKKSEIVPVAITVKKNTNPFLDYDNDSDNIELTTDITDAPCNNFPFDLPVKSQNYPNNNESNTTVSSYDATCDMSDPETVSIVSQQGIVMPRRLFANDTCDNSIQYSDEPSAIIDSRKFGHSTLLNDQVNCNFSTQIYQNEPLFVFGRDTLNKQSKILGCDVTNITRSGIFDCDNDRQRVANTAVSNVAQNSKLSAFIDNSKCNKKDTIKSSSKISLKIFGKLKDVFKHEKKPSTKMSAVNPYEVVRKPAPQEKVKVLEPVCFENPALNLNSTDTDFQYMDDENSSIDEPSATCSFNNKNPLEITPMKRSRNSTRQGKENFTASQVMSSRDCGDVSDAYYQSENNAKKQVRFDTTQNHEKFITGNSFDSDNNSLGSSNRSIQLNNSQVFHEIDSQIDEYHNELENCFNEQKYITQNL